MNRNDINLAERKVLKECAEAGIDLDSVYAISSTNKNGIKELRLRIQKK